MSFNNNQFGPYRVVKEEKLIQGKDIELLCENNYKGVKQYYKVSNYTTFIDKIEPSDKKENMVKLSLVFNNGKKATTHAYIDDVNIKEKTIVSVIGYVTKYNNEYQLYCRGITPIYTNIDELLNADLNKYVKVDLIINLSDIEESTVYYETNEVQRIQGTDYYYIEKIDKQVALIQYLTRFKEKNDKVEQKEVEVVQELTNKIDNTTEEQTVEMKVNNRDTDITTKCT